MKISLHGLDKGAVLAAMYNASRPQGMGFLQYDPTPMSAEEGSRLLDDSRYFDYLKGRVMKLDLNSDELDVTLYDRDNGEGAGAKVIAALRNTATVNPEEIQEAHKSGVVAAANLTGSRLNQPWTVRKADMGEVLTGVPNGTPITEITMGLSDVKDILAPKIDEAINKAVDPPATASVAKDE